VTQRTASLGMYDGAALQTANDALWTAVAAHLRNAGVRNVPDRLDRERPLDGIWSAPELLLAQTCGYPLTTGWRGRLRYVATPRYRAAGCEGSSHRSRLVVRADDPAETLKAFRGRRAAINDRASNTGMNLFRAAIAPLAAGQAFFESVVETGSHADSARAIASGAVDIAAIDAVSFAHLERHDPNLVRQLRTLGWTTATPGLPLVTATDTSARDVAALRRALLAAAEDRALDGVRDRLLLDGFDVLRPARYHAVLRLEAKAVRASYPVLR
jgi:ABC-type phosphate/phosphonate transport system substrate-binding protein